MFCCGDNWLHIVISRKRPSLKLILTSTKVIINHEYLECHWPVSINFNFPIKCRYIDSKYHFLKFRSFKVKASVDFFPGILHKWFSSLQP